ILSECVKLFVDRESVAQTRCRRMRGVFDDDDGLLRPGVLFEIGAKEDAVVLPFVQRIGRAVRAEKSATSVHEIQNGRLLVNAEPQLACRQRKEQHIVSTKQGSRDG